MKNIETALFNVFQAIGNDYDFPDPEAEFIINEFDANEQFRNPYFGQTPDAVKFEKGTQKELNIWLKDTSDKYPVGWLVYPVTSKFKNDLSGRERFNARLVFATNNTSDKLIDERLQTTGVVLHSIVDRFLELMRNSSFRKYISMDKTVECVREFRPNYSTKVSQTENGTVEIWDAVTLDCVLILIPNCIPDAPIKT